VKRQLRFALFLQIAGFIMFLTAAVVRFFAFGLDALTTLLSVAALIAGGLAVFTREQLRRIPPA
jgi:hypothetical protein